MRVVAHSRSRRDTPDWEGFAWLDIDALLAESDVVSLHCPLTPETEGMINAERIASMKSGARVINVARGGLIDEEALAAALSAGKLAGAAIDVFPAEPKSNKDEFVSPLRGLDNVILVHSTGEVCLES